MFVCLLCMCSSNRFLLVAAWLRISNAVILAQRLSLRHRSWRVQTLNEYSQTVVEIDDFFLFFVLQEFQQRIAATFANLGLCE
jgi:hypothetical protein